MGVYGLSQRTLGSRVKGNRTISFVSHNLRRFQNETPVDTARNKPYYNISSSNTQPGAQNPPPKLPQFVLQKLILFPLHIIIRRNLKFVCNFTFKIFVGATLNVDITFPFFPQKLEKFISLHRSNHSKQAYKILASRVSFTILFHSINILPMLNTCPPEEKYILFHP